MGLHSPATLVKNAVQKGYGAIALVDDWTISGVPEFVSECSKHGVQPIIGATLGNVTAICRNKSGWLKLIELISLAHTHYDKSPQLNYDEVPWDDDDFILFDEVPEVRYLNEDDWVDYKTVLCASLSGCTLSNVHSKLGDNPLKRFFNENKYYLDNASPSSWDHLPEEVDSFKVSNRPQFPDFPVPAGVNVDEYLRELCRQGWREKIQHKVHKDKQNVYAERVKYELSVLQGVGLSSYFLVVADFMAWARNQGWILGRGRGSSAGCLVSYLLGITQVDPIPYGLVFERFYNAGRNTADKVSPPDIDCDLPSSKRDLVIEYVSNKYGKDKVAPIITFQSAMGRGAIKDVLRVTERVSFGEMNRLTKFIPDKEKISDQLKDMEDEGLPPSILLWTLKNRGELLKEWAFIDKDGEIKGDLAPQFKQAIKLEGCKKGSGRHAAGIVLGKEPLNKCAPMVYDRKTKSPIVGYEMDSLDTVGLLKFDLLGVAVLDKLQMVEYIARHGKPPDY